MKPRPVNKLTLDDMQRLADRHNGRCVSSEYLGFSRQHRWQCEAGHEWDSTPRNVKASNWCLVCRGQQPGRIDELQAVAAARGGRCVSTEYVDARTRLEWECAEGHRWFALPSSVKSRTWCPVCRCSPRRFANLEALARRHGGRCLATPYHRGATEALTFECSKGHTWLALPDRIVGGEWCPVCSPSQQDPDSLWGVWGKVLSAAKD
jgi:hypothetical protein